MGSGETRALARAAAIIALVIAALGTCPTVHADDTRSPVATSTSAASSSAQSSPASRAPLASQPPLRHRLTGRSIGLGLAGVLSAFVAHEAGHIGANLALGNVPKFQGLLVWGFVPFFVVAPQIDCYADDCRKADGSKFGPGRRGKYFIVTAGYHVQHITDELILSLDPDLRFHAAPFQKGMLAFNLFLSAFYSLGAWTGLEDPHGDLGGASRLSGINEILLSAALMTPAVIDAYRYYVGSDARWTPWVSRASKALFVGLNFSF